MYPIEDSRAENTELRSRQNYVPLGTARQQMLSSRKNTARQCCAILPLEVQYCSIRPAIVQTVQNWSAKCLGQRDSLSHSGRQASRSLL